MTDVLTREQVVEGADPLNPSQREVALTFGRPLMVAAGAGTGKSSTLKRRVAAALLPAQTGEPPVADRMDQIVATTFTEAAASELKGKVRAQLLACAGEVDDPRERARLEGEALAVDDARIGTIHGLCARIIRENALAFGVDPEFEVLDEARRFTLLRAALEEAIAALDADPDLAALKRCRFSSDALFGMAVQLRDKAAGIPNGLRDYRPEELGATGASAGVAGTDPNALVRELVAAAEQLLCDLAGKGAPLTQSEGAVAGRAQTAAAAAERYLARGGWNPGAPDIAELVKVVMAFPVNNRAKKMCQGFFETYARIACAVYHFANALILPQLVAFTRVMDQAYERLRGPARLDNDDLLAVAERGLTAHPQVAQRYRRAIRLIMVDEFQDTNQMQVSIIRRIAAPDLSNVCCVGDRQQSIYRFRGADAHVTGRFGRAMGIPAGAENRLDQNYRSHADILAFVERVFAQESVWGRDYLRLTASDRLAHAADEVFDAGVGFPRVSVVVAQGGTKKEASEEAARDVACWFAELRDRGADPAGMAVLMGTMGKAGVYVHALEERGFRCLVTAGSGFGRAREVLVIEALARLLARGYDDESLYTVLRSQLFDVSEEGLVRLKAFGRSAENGFELCVGFAYDARAIGLGPTDEARVLLAQVLLVQGAQRALEEGLAEGVRLVLRESGWMSWLDGEGSRGIEQAANTHRALEILRGYDQSGCGPAQASAYFSELLGSGNETVGTLALNDASHVKIMTVHGSKGLEFDYVAVVEMKNGDDVPQPESFQKLMVEVVGEKGADRQGAGEKAAGEKGAEEGRPRLQAAMKPSVFLRPDERKTLGSLRAYYDGPDLPEFALERLCERERLAEAQRLYYVAFTRAKKALMYVMANTRKAFDSGTAPKGVDASIAYALDVDFSEKVSLETVDFGGEKPAHVVRTGLVDEDDFPIEPPGFYAWAPCGRADGGLAKTRAFPVVDELERAAAVPGPVPLASRAREGVYSYTSIAALAGHAAGHFGHGAAARAMAPSWDDPEEMWDLMPDDPMWDVPVRANRTQDNPSTRLGTAFHQVCRRAIEDAAARGAGAQGGRASGEAHGVRRLMADPAVVGHAIRANNLVADQPERLRCALDRWFASDAVRELAAEGDLQAELPFFVALDERVGVYLEGEIDALALTGDTAYLVDYKTGGFDDEPPARLEEKYALQAKCYAYALLSEGFTTVLEVFVRVEQPDPLDPTQPQCVRYTFKAEDHEALRREILDCIVE